MTEADTAISEVEALRAENAELRKALNWLITLKKHKDLFGKDADYKREQPEAWAFALKALTTQTQEAGNG